MSDSISAVHDRLRVAVVAPTLRILGGQSVQADRLIRGWQSDPQVEAWLVPVNPAGPGLLGRAQRIKYVRTAVTQALYWPLLARELRRADVVHAFSASYSSFVLSPWPAIRVARALGKPVLLNYHSGEAPDHLARSPLARRTLRSVDRNVVPSRFLQGVFAAHGLQADVIPNVIDVERYRFRRRDPVRPRLISTRNLEPLYNVSCTLRAFALVQARYPDATLTIVGAGSDRANLARLCGSLGLRHVTFVGRVPPADIWRYYADADVYVQTPNIDNMPLSVLEAWASGTPVVSTGVGGVPALVTAGQNGLLAPVDDAGAVAAAVLRVLGEPGLASRLSEAGYKSVDAYTWARVRPLWLRAYRSIAHAPNALPDPVAAR